MLKAQSEYGTDTGGRERGRKERERKEEGEGISKHDGTALPCSVSLS